MKLLRTLLIPVAALLGGCATTRPAPEVVDHVDLDRYLGTWYEIARLPAKFQENCMATTATYSLREDGDIKVVNRCRKGSFDGELNEAEGHAWIVDPKTNAKLKVTFFWPFKGDYWVLALDESYRWSLVGSPDYKYLWILSRRPEMDDETWRGILETARGKGYDVMKLLRTPQTPTVPPPAQVLGE